jgi:hypothetical protein
MVEGFPLIRNWQVGTVKRVCIGEDPWVSVDQSFKLSTDCIEALHDQGILVYFVWWDPNHNVFQDKYFLPSTVAAMIVKLST